MGEIKNTLKQGVKYSGVPRVLRTTSQITTQSIKKSRLAGRKIPFLKGITLRTLLEEKNNY